MASSKTPLRTTSKATDQPSEEELHYKSLISAFKWMVSIGALFLAFIVGLGTFLTYSSFKDLRSEIKESKEEAKAELKEINLEAERTAQNVRYRMDGTVMELTGNINQTRNEALGQISGFKDLVINQAKAKVEDVFEKRNLEGYIEEVAKTRLEGKMTDIADRTVTQLDKSKIDKVIRDLNSDEQYIVDKAYMTLFYEVNREFDSDQTDALLKYIDNRKSGYWMGEGVVSLVAERRSPKVTKYFIESLSNPQSNWHPSALYHLVKVNPKTSIGVFENYIVSSKDKRKAFGDLVNTCKEKPALLLEVLNSVVIVDTLYKEYGAATFNEMKANTKQSTASVVNSVAFEKSYLNAR